MMRGGLFRPTHAHHCVLLRRGDLPVQLAHVEALGLASQAAGDPGDLASAGREHEHVGGRVGLGQVLCSGCRGARDMVEERPGHSALIQPGCGAGRPDLGQRKGGDAVIHDGGVGVLGAQHARQVLRVEGGGHGHDDEVVAQLPHLAEQPDQQVGLQRPLVHLVDDHGADAVEARVVQHPPQQHTGGDELDAGIGPDPALAADGEAHPVAQRRAVQLRQSSGCGTSRHASGLGDDHSAGGARDQQRRDERGLPGTRRSGHDDCARGFQRPRQLVEGSVEGQALPDAVQVERSAVHESIFSCPSGAGSPLRW